VNIYFTIIDGGSQYQGASAIACSKKKTKKEGYWQYIQLNLAKIQKEHDCIPTASRHL
jgi:hypothetical protein